jgi:hypothetical protein
MSGSIAGTNEIVPIVPAPPPFGVHPGQPSCHAYAAPVNWFHTFLTARAHAVHVQSIGHSSLMPSEAPCRLFELNRKKGRKEGFLKKTKSFLSSFLPVKK